MGIIRQRCLVGRPVFIRSLPARSLDRPAQRTVGPDPADPEGAGRARVPGRASRPAGRQGRAPRGDLAGRVPGRRRPEGVRQRDPARARRRCPASRGSSRPPTGAATGSSPTSSARRPAPAPPVGLPPASPPRLPVQYARSGDVNIAYQVLGSGPIDLVFVMGWVSHLEYFWNEPSFARFLRRLAGFSRLILFDKRGTGLSDRIADLPTLEERMEDVRAVLSAAGSRRAVLLGVSEGGPMCSLFAATYPDQTEALIMIGTYARRLRAPDYPWAPTHEEREAFCREILEHWGGPVGIETRAPSVAADPAFREWWAAYLRMGASPAAAVALTRMNAQIDVRHVLPTIRVPTLVLHRTGDRCLLVEEGRYVASLVPGARFVELPGDDHLPFVGRPGRAPRRDRAIPDRRARRAPNRTGCSPRSCAPPCADRTPPDRPLPRSIACRRSSPPRRSDSGGAICSERATVPFRRSTARPARSGAAAPSWTKPPAWAWRSASDCTPENGTRSAPSARGRWRRRPREIAALAGPGDVLVSRTVVDLVAGSGFQFSERGQPRARGRRRGAAALRGPLTTFLLLPNLSPRTRPGRTRTCPWSGAGFRPRKQERRRQVKKQRSFSVIQGVGALVFMTSVAALGTGAGAGQPVQGVRPTRRIPGGRPYGRVDPVHGR